MSSSHAGRKPLVLFLDWDETISAHDTLSLIAPTEGTHPGPDAAHYTKAYLDDLQRHDDEYPDKQRDTLEAHLRYLESLDEVELTSQRRIEQGGLFRGFDHEAMKQRAREKVTFRKGWEKAMLNGFLRGKEYHVISVGWSASFIEAALQSRAEEGDTDCLPASICANEIEAESGRISKSRDDGANGIFSNGRYGIRIAQHKQREMRRIIREKYGCDYDGVTTVFAGDSNTDLPCLLDADVGLILGDNEGLQKTIDRLGLAKHFCKDVDEWKRKMTSDPASRPNLIKVGDWHTGAEVLSFLETQRGSEAA